MVQFKIGNKYIQIHRDFGKPENTDMEFRNIYTLLSRISSQLDNVASDINNLKERVSVLEAAL